MDELGSVPGLRAEAGSRPACESLSFASPKERNQRKGDPTVCVPCASLRGNLRCSGLAGSRSNSLRFTSLRQSRALIRQTLRSSAHPEGQGSRTSTRAFASLGPACAARGACARETGPSAAQRSNGPCGCPFWVPFCACREAQGRGCVRVPKDTRTSCTDSPQLFERSAAGAQRVLRWHPLTEHRRLPRSAAKGTRAVGSPSLW